MNGEGALPFGGRGVALAFLGAVSVSLVAFWALAAGYGTSTLVMVALVLPLLVVLLPLFYIGTQVASRADDPDEVESRLAESLGMSKPEFDRRRKGEDRYAHPAEREFEDE
jgi:fatty acid desaturase